MKKKLLALFPVLVLSVFLASFTYAANSDKHNSGASHMIFDMGEVSLIETVDKDGYYTMSVNRGTMAFLRELMAEDEEAAIALYDEILATVGFDARFIQRMTHEEKLARIIYGAEIYSSTVYMGVDSAGKVVVLSREECMAQIGK